MGEGFVVIVSFVTVNESWFRLAKIRIDSVDHLFTIGLVPHTNVLICKIKLTVASVCEKRYDLDAGLSINNRNICSLVHVWSDTLVLIIVSLLIDYYETPWNAEYAAQWVDFATLD